MNNKAIDLKSVCTAHGCLYRGSFFETILGENRLYVMGTSINDHKQHWHEIVFSVTDDEFKFLYHREYLEMGDTFEEIVNGAVRVAANPL